MAVFAIADLHLPLGAGKPMDIFPGWDNYVQKLEENWHRVVGPQDTVVIAGDISWAMTLPQSQKDFNFIHGLPGKKLILKGNHDFWWSTRTKMEIFFLQNDFYDIAIMHNSACVIGDIAVCGTRGWMYNSVTDEDQKIVNREAGRLEASILEAERLNKRPMVFLHYPPVYDGIECEELLSVLQRHEIRECFFGHIHGKGAAQKAVTGLYKGIQMRLISCDFINFCPILAAK